MTTHTKALIATSPLLLLHPIVHADVFSADDQHFGANTLTIDTDQQLEFLDLTLTTRRTVVQLQSALETGGDFEGFRHATGQEVLTLISNAGFNAPNLGSNAVFPASQAFTDFVQMTSVTGSIANIDLSRGSVSDLATPTRARLIALEDFAGSSNDIIATSISTGLNERSRSIGHWIVRDIPTPSATLPLAATITLTTRRRRDK